MVERSNNFKSGSLFYVRYLDHVLFKNMDSDLCRPVVREVVGWLVKESAEARKERLQEIARLIQKSLFSQNEIPLPQTVAQLRYEFGLTKEKIREYIELLQNLGRFTLDEKKPKIKKIIES